MMTKVDISYLGIDFLLAQKEVYYGMKTASLLAILNKS